MRLAAHVFLGAVIDRFVLGELFADRLVVDRFVRVQRGLARSTCVTSTLRTVAAFTRSTWNERSLAAALDQRHDRMLMAAALTDSCDPACGQ